MWKQLDLLLVAMQNFKTSRGDVSHVKIISLILRNI